MKIPWRSIRIVVLTAIIASPVLLGGGCDDDFEQFRAEIRPGLELGTRYMLDGLVSGTFAALDSNHGLVGATGETTDGLTGGGGSPAASAGETGT